MAELIVSYDITASSENETATGAEADSTVNGYSHIIVEGNIAAEGAQAIGAQALVKGGAEPGTDSTISVNGDVTATAKNLPAFGVMTDVNDGNANVEVGGSVAASGNSDADGIYVRAFEAQTDTSVMVQVGGDVTAAGSTENSCPGIGIVADVGGSATVSMEVAGDVTGNTNGMFVRKLDSGDPGIDVLIEGTLTGDEQPILVYGDQLEDALTITVWKIDGGSDTVVKAIENTTADAAAIEENIYYIIKYEDPAEGATLALDGVTDSHGFSCAHEDEVVRLKPTIAAATISSALTTAMRPKAAPPLPRTTKATSSSPCPRAAACT